MVKIRRQRRRRRRRWDFRQWVPHCRRLHLAIRLATPSSRIEFLHVSKRLWIVKLYFSPWSLFASENLVGRRLQLSSVHFDFTLFCPFAPPDFSFLNFAWRTRRPSWCNWCSFVSVRRRGRHLLTLLALSRRLLKGFIICKPMRISFYFLLFFSIQICTVARLFIIKTRVCLRSSSFLVIAGLWGYDLFILWSSLPPFFLGMPTLLWQVASFLLSKRAKG